MEGSFRDTSSATGISSRRSLDPKLTRRKQVYIQDPTEGETARDGNFIEEVKGFLFRFFCFLFFQRAEDVLIISFSTLK